MGSAAPAPHTKEASDRKSKQNASGFKTRSPFENFNPDFASHGENTSILLPVKAERKGMNHWKREKEHRPAQMVHVPPESKTCRGEIRHNRSSVILVFNPKRSCGKFSIRRRTAFV